MFEVKSRLKEAERQLAEPSVHPMSSCEHLYQINLGNLQIIPTANWGAFPWDRRAGREKLLWWCLTFSFLRNVKIKLASLFQNSILL